MVVFLLCIVQTVDTDLSNVASPFKVGAALDSAAERDERLVLLEVLIRDSTITDFD